MGIKFSTFQRLHIEIIDLKGRNEILTTKYRRICEELFSMKDELEILKNEYDRLNKEYQSFFTYYYDLDKNK